MKRRRLQSSSNSGSCLGVTGKRWRELPGNRKRSKERTNNSSAQEGSRRQRKPYRLLGSATANPACVITTSMAATMSDLPTGTLNNERKHPDPVSWTSCVGNLESRAPESSKTREGKPVIWGSLRKPELTLQVETFCSKLPHRSSLTCNSSLTETRTRETGQSNPASTSSKHGMTHTCCLTCV